MDVQALLTVRGLLTLLTSYRPLESSRRLLFCTNLVRKSFKMLLTVSQRDDTLYLETALTRSLKLLRNKGEILWKEIVRKV